MVVSTSHVTKVILVFYSELQVYYALQFSVLFLLIIFAIIFYVLLPVHAGQQFSVLQARRYVMKFRVDNEVDSSDDDGLPPLQANMNRTRPADLQSDTDSECNSTP